MPHTQHPPWLTYDLGAAHASVHELTLRTVSPTKVRMKFRRPQVLPDVLPLPQDPTQDPTSHQSSLLHRLLWLWWFVALTLFFMTMTGDLFGSFVCLAIRVCLIFSWFDWGYGFGEGQDPCYLHDLSLWCDLDLPAWPTKRWGLWSTALSSCPFLTWVVGLLLIEW